MPLRTHAPPDDSAGAILDALAARLSGATTKAAGTTPGTTRAHGPGGMLSTPGLDPNIVNAMVIPLQGLAAELPVHMSNEVNPVFGILTGQTADVGAEPTLPCDLGPVAGNLKLCQQTWTYGRMSMQSSVLDITAAGQIVNRGEFLDHRLVGNPFAQIPQTPILTGPARTNALARNEAEKSLFELTAGWFRRYAKLIFTGNPVNTVGSTGYIEYNGLDRIINTGYKDSITNVVCPRADSLIVSYALDMGAGTNGAVLVNIISEIIRNRRYFAAEVGLGDVEHALVMPYGLFYALTAIWPCAYNTTGCVLPASATQFVNSSDQINMRDDMRQRNVLRVDDGREIRVIVDNSIAETYNAGTDRYTSGIYLVPLRAAGMDLTYWDFFNFRGPNGALEVAQRMAPADQFMASSDGRFLVTKQSASGWCVQAGMIARPRIVMRAPFLAARVTGVSYSLRFPTISPFIGAPGYANGGNTGYAGTTYVSPV